MTSCVHSSDILRAEIESLRYVLKDHMEIDEVVGHQNEVIYHCSVDYPFPSLKISFILPEHYPDTYARVTLHHADCKTNILYHVRTNTEWEQALCENPSCCTDLQATQSFVYNLAKHFSGSSSLMALVLAVKKDVHLSPKTGFSVSNNYMTQSAHENMCRRTSTSRKVEVDPLSLLPCTRENFMKWQAAFVAEKLAEQSKAQNEKLENVKCTGREYFELNVDAKEVDWGLFE